MPSSGILVRLQFTRFRQNDKIFIKGYESGIILIQHHNHLSGKNNVF